MNEHDLVLVANDNEDRVTGDEGVRVGSPVGTRHSARTPNSPSPAVPGGAAATASPGPYTPDEFLAVIDAVWNFSPSEVEEDLTRFNELLHAALVFIGRVASDGYVEPPEAAAELLRSVEQRALWGPDHPVRQP